MNKIFYFNHEISSDFQHTVTIIVPIRFIPRFKTWKSSRTNGFTTTFEKIFPTFTLAQEFCYKTPFLYSISPNLHE